MNLLYKSTRDASKTVTASEAVLKGLAEDGGLFVPTSIPKLDVTMDDLKDMSYQDTAYAVMKQFLTDYTEEELRHCINSAYARIWSLSRQPGSSPPCFPAAWSSQ